jgi:hypothetical protein
MSLQWPARCWAELREMLRGGLEAAEPALA